MPWRELGGKLLLIHVEGCTIHGLLATQEISGSGQKACTAYSYKMSLHHVMCPDLYASDAVSK